MQGAPTRKVRRHVESAVAYAACRLPNVRNACNHRIPRSQRFANKRVKRNTAMIDRVSSANDSNKATHSNVTKLLMQPCVINLAAALARRYALSDRDAHVVVVVVAVAVESTTLSDEAQMHPLFGAQSAS